MKKKICILVVLILLFTIILTACGNKQISDWNYTFERAYIKIGDTWKDVELKKWRDYEDGEQFQLTLMDDTVLVVSSINCILYNGTLPIED